jgi:hypothetical protein
MLPSTKYSTDVCHVMKVCACKGDIHLSKTDSLLTHGIPAMQNEIEAYKEITLIVICQAT